MDPDRLKHPSSSNRNKEDIREETASRYMALGVQISRSGESFENPLRLKVTSGSISPLLRPGDAIYLEFAEPESLKRGDIVTFPVDQNLMTHRLISTSPGSCLTKGDASLRADPPIDRSSLLGRIVAYDHEGKTVWMRGFFWHEFNRLAGLKGFWESQAARLGDHLIRRNRGARLPTWLSFFSRLYIGIARLPLKVILKLYYEFIRL